MKKSSLPSSRFQVLRQKCNLATSHGRFKFTSAVSHPRDGGDVSTSSIREDGEDGARQDSARETSTQFSVQQGMKLLRDRVMVEPVMPEASIYLQYRRAQHNLSQEALAVMVGTTVDVINRIEIGVGAVKHDIWQRILHSVSRH